MVELCTSQLYIGMQIHWPSLLASPPAHPLTVHFSSQSSLQSSWTTGTSLFCSPCASVSCSVLLFICHYSIWHQIIIWGISPRCLCSSSHPLHSPCFTPPLLFTSITHFILRLTGFYSFSRLCTFSFTTKHSRKYSLVPSYSWPCIENRSKYSELYI